MFLDHSECSAVRSQAGHLIANMISHKFEVHDPTLELQWLVSIIIVISLNEELNEFGWFAEESKRNKVMKLHLSKW